MTTAVIANTGNGGYAHAKVQRPRAVVMGDKERADLVQERADLEARARAGEWLKSGSVATLLDIGRTKTHTLLTSGKIGYRRVAGGTQRLCNPEDVLRLLEESRQMETPPAASE